MTMPTARTDTLVDRILNAVGEGDLSRLIEVAPGHFATAAVSLGYLLEFLDELGDEPSGAIGRIAEYVKPLSHSIFDQAVN